MDDLRMEISWWAWGALAALFAALTTIFAKIGLSAVHPDLATLIRTAVLLPILAGLVHWGVGWSNPLRLPPKALLFLFASALATGASWICYFRALRVGEAAKVAAIDKLSLLLVTILGWIALNERLSMREWIGIALIGMGAIVITTKS